MLVIDALDEVSAKSDGDTVDGVLRKLVLNPEIRDIFDFRFDDVSIVDYDPYPAIKAPVAV